MKQNDQKKDNYSRIIISSCFGLQAVGVGIYIAFGVFFTPLMSEFGWPRALISGASATAFFISGLFGMIIGKLNDRIGPKTIMKVTALFFSAGCILLSRTTTVWELYLFLGIIFGIGLSSVDVISLTTVARWFPEKRGIMTGIAKVGTGAGQLAFPLLTSVLITGYGWRNACIMLGITSLILMMVIAQLLKKEPGNIGNNQTRQHPGPTVHQANGDFSLRQAAGTIRFWMICLINLTILSCLLSVIVHIVPHSRDLGITVHKAAGVLSTIGGVSMAGRFITGIVIDKIGSKRSMLMALSVLVTSVLWLQTADQLWKLYIFALIYGLAHGGFFTVISPIVAEIFGTESHGALFGIVAFFGTVGGAIGPIVTGYLFDMSGSYRLSIWLALVVSILGLGLLFFLTSAKSSD